MASRHGTRSRFVQGCRCDPCTEANRTYQAKWRLRHGQVPRQPGWTNKHLAAVPEKVVAFRKRRGGVNEGAVRLAKPGRCRSCGAGGLVNAGLRKSWDGLCAECRAGGEPWRGR